MNSNVDEPAVHPAAVQQIVQPAAVQVKPEVKTKNPKHVEAGKKVQL